MEEISGGDSLLLGKREVKCVRTVHRSTSRVRIAEARRRSVGWQNDPCTLRLLRSGGNVLMLDEPTNDLDVDTLRSLEEAILALRGVCWSSHDRWFGPIATHHGIRR
jgi:ABC-type iron transport system FetAB ATPase subunit